MSETSTKKLEKTALVFFLFKLIERVFSKFCTLCMTETQAALLSLLAIGALFVAVVILSLTFWLGLMVVVLWILYEHGWSYSTITLFLMLLQLLLMIPLCFMIRCYGKKLLFPKVRAAIRNFL